MNTIIFYYWMTNIVTGEKEMRMCFDYLGDVGDIIAGGLLITDWTFEEEILEGSDV